ncbi:RluA family pseudouridine synthase [Parabacteroides sp. FAFU027]|uniref:RluA family pseudouridine synthase n=1 Tax=Parabacteroides sp. FAFU027 TaxID=2922715 RepID=UPI001FAEED24|nr:RluA family pseudouridine synthase [Parabacteroides sp. FAFU027]
MTPHPLHFFKHPIDSLALPEKFTYPFNYTPHPLCVVASGEVQDYLRTRTDWAEELSEGKMFGVLVVQTDSGELGYLAAFSGNLAGRNDHEYFVPPVFDLLHKDGFFKMEEREITAINHRIRQLSHAPECIACHALLKQETHQAQQELASQKALLKANKATRDERRNSNPSLSENELAEMVRVSQFEKAEYKRLEKRWQTRLAEFQQEAAVFHTEIEQLKAERKTKSAALQQKLFDCFQMLNSKGEAKGLCDIFAQTAQKIPPAGAGECAAPKLLQYAFRHGLKPIAMAEFWCGASPKTEIRHHGHFYPACKGKCEPILGHMLQGMELDTDPQRQATAPNIKIEILYEDDYLLIIHKPSGLLSVPGKSSHDSAYQRIRERYPEATGPLVVHRLDMSTSGLLLIAKTKEVHKSLQAQFKGRSIKKRYITLLDGLIAEDSGSIDLPLTSDYNHRPRQMVDMEGGKPALTLWRVLERTAQHTRIEFTPVTGRTHQLRVHAAHPLGLNTPIVGDELYGRKAERLYLHAEYLEFVHPVTGVVVTVEKMAEF